MDSDESEAVTVEAAVAAAATTANTGLNAALPPPFLSKTYEMVDDPATDAVVSWGPANNSFVVWNATEFSRDLLPKYFKHNNFSSFVRQLNTYGFRKVDPDQWEFANEGFLRGQKHLLKYITRRKSTHAHSPQQQSQPQNTIEVGKFGLEEEIGRLKRDKNVLMQELVRLRQQQQTTDQQLNTLGQRLQGMEQRQQQMVSFLAKAMQSPGFLAQFVQQNDSNRHRVALNKKRRLPRQENNLDAESTLQDGQIIKYQPLINEAAKAMLMQILKNDTSPVPESFGNHPNLLTNNFSSPLETFDSRTPLKRISGVTLSEVPSNSVAASLHAGSGYSAMPSSSMPSEIQSFSDAEMVTIPGIPNMNVGSGTFAPQPQTNGVPELPRVHTMLPSGASQSYMAPNGGSIPLNRIPEVMNQLGGIESDKFPSETDIGVLNDDDDKLPGMSDSFWEQILRGSSLLEDAEEVDPGTHEIIDTTPESVNGWDSVRNMNYLTEQMGNLASQTNRY